MSDFITILKGIEVASSEQGVRAPGQYKNISGEEFLAKLRVVQVGEKDGSNFVRTGLKQDNNGRCMSRGDENACSLARVVVIDADKRMDCSGQESEGAPDPFVIHQVLERNNIGHVIHGSYSHYAGGKRCRYRIVLVAKEAYSREQLSATVEEVILLINQSLDVELLAHAKENGTFSQAWLYARKPKECTVPLLYFEHLEGDAVSVFNPIDFPRISHVVHSWKPQQAGEISPIAAFNKQKKLTDLLVQYGYKLKLTAGGHEKWLSPNSSSGVAGITVKNDKFFSHHNDECNDGYWHDSFDLMRDNEGLSVHDAVIRVAQSTIAPDGRTVDEHNKSLAKLKHANSAPVIEFKEYQAFDDKLLPVENVPYEALPDVMASFIREQSDIRGCSEGYILVSLLARMGCVFSGKVQVELTRNTGWAASPNFFWAMIGDPSSGKSNALSATSKPIQLLSADAKEGYSKELYIYLEKKELLDSKLSAAKKGMEQELKKASLDGSKAAKFEESFKALKADLGALERSKPVLKRYTVTKTTVEKLILILEENPDGVMLEVHELSSSFVKLSKDEHADERGLYLSGFTGDTQYAYDTVNRGTVFIPRLLLSIFGGIQPAKLKRFLNDARVGYQDDGLIQRFQGVVYPDRNTKELRDKRPSTELINAIHRMFSNLDTIPTGSMLSFDDDAQEMFNEHRTRTAEKAHDLGQPLEAHLVKSHEFIASLAVYLYLAENDGQLTPDKKITAEHTLNAIRLGDYFFSHAKRMYGLVYKKHIPARSLSEKLVKLVVGSKTGEHFDYEAGHYFFTRSQIRAKGWTDLIAQEDRRQAIDVLVEHGHISKAYGGKYYLNPKHLNE